MVAQSFLKSLIPSVTYNVSLLIYVFNLSMRLYASLLLLGYALVLGVGK